MNESFAADLDYLRIEDDGYEFVPQSTGGELRQIVGRETHALSYEHGRLRQLRLDRHGRAHRLRRPFVIKDLVYRADRYHQTERGQLLLFPLDPDGAAIRHFVGLIPRELWQRTTPYPEEMQLRVLQLFLHGGERALWLHDHGCHGMVAVLATADWLLRKPVPIAMLHAWLQLPQPQILQQVGLPASPRVARILNRLPASSCDYSALRNLRRLHDPRLAREVSHLPQIHEAILLALDYLTPQRLITANCLRELSELRDSQASGVLCRLSDRLSWHEKLEAMLGGRLRLPLFTHVDKILDLDDLKFYASQPAFKQSQCLMRPPFADVPGLLTWIRTPGELLREGRQMNNCIFTYLNRIIHGTAAAAIVERGDVRATLAMTRSSLQASWYLDELRLKNNDKPPYLLVTAIFNWLDEQRRSPPPEAELHTDIPF